VRLRGGNVALSGVGQAGRLFLVRGLDLTLANVNSDGTEPDDDGVTGLVIEGQGAVSITAGTSVGQILVSGNSVTGGSLDAGTSLRLSSVELTDFSTLRAGSVASLTSTGLTAAGTFAAGTDGLIISSGDVRLGNAGAGRDLDIQAGGAAALGTILAGDDVRVRASTITVSEARATGLGPDTGEIGSGDGSNIDMGSTLDATVTRAQAANAITLASSEGSVQLDDGRAGAAVTLIAAAGSARSGGHIEAQRLGVSAGQDIALTDVTTVADVVLGASGGVVSGRSLVSDGDIDVTAASGVTLASADAGSIKLDTGGGIRLDTARADRLISLSAGGGDIRLGALASDGDVFAQTLGGAIGGTGPTTAGSLTAAATSSSARAAI
jgi:filamentous hemagglutinin